MRPQVSVIITTYNRANWLVEAVRSVLAQSYTDYELIIADDGSTDKTAERLATFGNTIRYLQLPHSGRPESVRNQAVAASQGRLIAFLDDDDLWDETKLAQQVAIFEEQSDVGLSYTDFRFLYGDNSRSDGLLSIRHKQAEAAFNHLLTNCFIHPSTVMIRRRLFDQVGPFEDRFYCQGDYYLWLRAAHTASVHCIPTPLVTVRKHENSLAQQRGIINFQDTIQVLERLRTTTSLKRKQVLHVQQSLARLHTHVGLHFLQNGDPSQARQLFLRSLRLNPWQRRAWMSLGQSLFFGRS